VGFYVLTVEIAGQGFCDHGIITPGLKEVNPSSFGIDGHG
jgi:hypothetical protein